jgi:hypothetical protein
MPGFPWRDNGHKGLMPVIRGFGIGHVESLDGLHMRGTRVYAGSRAEPTQNFLNNIYRPLHCFISLSLTRLHEHHLRGEELSLLGNASVTQQATLRNIRRPNSPVHTTNSSLAMVHKNASHRLDGRQMGDRRV